MNRKLILKYLLLGTPFVVGSVMYSFGAFNVFSSLLFFGGGYIFAKNILDYRMIRKNISNVKLENTINCKHDSTHNKSAENIMGFKRTRRHTRVRKRVKY